MDDMIESYKRMIRELKASRLPLEIVASQIEYLENCIFEMERIDELCLMY